MQSSRTTSFLTFLFFSFGCQPSLFYQFIGKGEGAAAWDCYTFCEVLGGEEANRQLHNHWKTWVTEDHFIKMAAAGVNSLRVPIGDFQFIRK